MKITSEFPSKRVFSVFPSNALGLIMVIFGGGVEEYWYSVQKRATRRPNRQIWTMADCSLAGGAAAAGGSFISNAALSAAERVAGGSAREASYSAFVDKFDARKLEGSAAERVAGCSAREASYSAFDDKFDSRKLEGSAEAAIKRCRSKRARPPK